MHDAYTVFPPAKLPVQIESIAGFDNNVILGTRQGHLLMYSLTPNYAENKMDLQLLQYDKNFSKKPIVQIEVIPEYQLIVSLSDAQVNVNDLSRHNFPIVHVAAKTKGASVFALDIQRSKSLTGEVALLVRLCVAVKRRLQFWYWKHDHLLTLVQDIELNEVPKLLAWSNDTVCVGFKTDYCIYDISKAPATRRDLFPTSSSRSIDPCICRVDDHFFAMVKDNFLITVDSRHREKALFEEALKVTRGEREEEKSFKTIEWSEPLQMLVWDEPYAVGLVSDAVEVRVFESKGNNLIQKLPDLSRARFLIRGKKGTMYAASVSQLWCIQTVDIGSQVQHLLKEKNFRLAIQLAGIAEESDEEKKEKLKRIQTLYACDLFINKQFKESMKEFAKLDTDPCDVIRLFPDLLPPDSKKEDPLQLGKNLPELADKDLEDGYLALIDYLTEMRQKIKKELHTAAVAEGRPFGERTTPLLSIIDTTLLKCYLQTNDSLVASLLRLNHCHLDEAERMLKKFQKFGELIILYQTKGKHARALQLLQSQAEVAGSSLSGPDRTIQYLQHLGTEHRHLIFEFAGWVLQRHPDDGIRIFTEDVPEVESLPRAEVLDYLLKNHKSLVIPYLEHIIHSSWKEEKALFHNILIQQYRERILELKATPEGASAAVAAREKLVHFLRTSPKYHAEKVLGDFPYNDLFEERAIILAKLGKHEKVLAIYLQILGDVDTAVAYCDRVYDEEDEKAKDVYLLLVRTLLTPPTTPPYTDVKLHPRCLEPDTETVLDLLPKYATKINAAEVLRLLPDDTPLIRLKDFIITAKQHAIMKKRQGQIMSGLLYAENMRLHQQRIALESQKIVITELSVCSVCKKKFSNQPALVRRPNGEILHYACQDKVPDPKKPSTSGL